MMLVADAHHKPAYVEHQALAACVEHSAIDFHLPELLLYAVMSVERGQPGLVRRNRNGTTDHGLMQINSGMWLPYFQRKYGIKPRTLTNDACLSVRAAAYVLRWEINHANGNFWAGVGRFHSRNPALSEIYIQMVYSASLRITEGRR
jgi:soluble lytic murein transglycosylase-like protein